MWAAGCVRVAHGCVLRTLLWWQGADVVGKVDTTANTLSTIPQTGVAAATYRFFGAATVGTIVFFGPAVSLLTLASQCACPRP